MGVGGALIISSLGLFSAGLRRRTSQAQPE
jgi:hypothetical protein